MRFTIYGERCSGTNFLQESIQENFEVDVTWDYGWKHFFGFSPLLPCEDDDILFIGIVRDAYAWVNSLYRTPWHLQLGSGGEFLNTPIISRRLTGDCGIIEEDKHMYERSRYYENLFELRNVKTDFLINKMPKLVKKYILIRYEDLNEKFEETMKLISQYLPRKESPLIKPLWYKSNRDKPFVKNTSTFISESVFRNLPQYRKWIHAQEEALGYEGREKPCKG